MNYVSLIILLFSTALSLAQEPLTFNRTQPIEIPTGYTPGVFFIEANLESSGLELFVGGNFLDGAFQTGTARTYKKIGETWETDMDFGSLGSKVRFAKAQFGASPQDPTSVQEDILIASTRGIRLYLGTSNGNYETAFSLDVNLAFFDVTAFDYELDGDLDGLITGRNQDTGEHLNDIIRNNGDGTFTLVDSSFPSACANIEAGMVDNHWYITIGEYSDRGIYKVLEDGVSFEKMNSFRPHFFWTSMAFADLTNNGFNDIAISGSNSQGYADEKVYAYVDGVFIKTQLSGMRPIARGNIKYLDINDDGWLDAISVGQRNDEGDKLFQINYGVDVLSFSFDSQNFTDEFGKIIDFRFASLDVVKEDGLVKILVSGNRCYPETCLEAFLFTQVICTDTLWYEDVENDGFGDNYSVVCSVNQPKGYVPDNTDVFPMDETEWSDLDGDGLGDNADQCDDTPEGEPIDEFGCSSILSINDADVNTTLKLFPNPARDELSIQLPNNDLFKKVSIYNMVGQLIQTSTKSSFSVTGITSGQYIVKVESESTIYISRFIKN